MIAQLDRIIGDIKGNLAKIVNILSQYTKDSPDLVVFPELFLVGYPPRDLLGRTWFIAQTQKAINELIEISTKYPLTGIIVGIPLSTKKNTGRGLYNSCLLIYQGLILMSQHKSLFPIYDVFDEARYFDPTPEIRTVSFKSEMFGISICEDAWNDTELWLRRFFSGREN